MERDEGREDGWRGGRWAVRPGSDGEAGYPPPLRPVQEAVEGALAGRHPWSFPRAASALALGWDVLAPGGVAADTAPALPAQSLREHGIRVRRAPGGAGWCLNLQRSPRSRPRSQPAVPFGRVYVQRCIFVGGGLGAGGSVNAVTGSELLVAVRFSPRFK